MCIINIDFKEPCVVIETLQHFWCYLLDSVADNIITSRWFAIDIINRGGGGCDSQRLNLSPGYLLYVRRRKEMFYLTTNSKHGVRHIMVKDHSGSEREETRCRHMGYLFLIRSKVSFICIIPQTG